MTGIARRTVIVAVAITLVVGWILWQRTSGFPDVTAETHTLTASPDEFDIVSASGRCRAGKSEVAAISLETGEVDWRVPIPYTPNPRSSETIPVTAALTDSGIGVGYWGRCQPAGLLAIGADGTPEWQAVVSGKPWIAAIGSTGVVASGRDPTNTHNVYQVSVLDADGQLVKTYPGTPRPNEAAIVSGRGVLRHGGRTVWFLDLATGEQLATRKLPALVRSTFVTGDAIYFVHADLGLSGYSGNGEQVISVDVPEGIRLIEVLEVADKDAVLVLRRNDIRRVGLLDLTTGEFEWDREVRSNPSAAANGSIVVAGVRGDEGIIVYDRETRAQLVVLSGVLSRDVEELLITESGVILIVREGADYAAVSYSLDGRKQWTTQLLGEPVSDPVVTDDAVIVAGRTRGRDAGYVVALDRQSGEIRWDVPTEGAAWRLLVDADTGYVVTGDTFFSRD